MGLTCGTNIWGYFYLSLGLTCIQALLVGEIQPPKLEAAVAQCKKLDLEAIYGTNIWD